MSSTAENEAKIMLENAMELLDYKRLQMNLRRKDSRDAETLMAEDRFLGMLFYSCISVTAA